MGWELLGFRTALLGPQVHRSPAGPGSRTAEIHRRESPVAEHKTPEGNRLAAVEDVPGRRTVPQSEAGRWGSCHGSKGHSHRGRLHSLALVRTLNRRSWLQTLPLGGGIWYVPPAGGYCWSSPYWLFEGRPPWYAMIVRAQTKASCRCVVLTIRTLAGCIALDSQHQFSRFQAEKCKTAVRGALLWDGS